MVLGEIMAMGGAIGGALAQVYGTERTNASNEAVANNATAANMAEAQRNRDFQAEQVRAQQAYQTEMSNTAITRGMKDLRNAGLNPILAAGSPASSPSGGAASGSQGSAVTATMQNPLAGLGTVASSALEAVTLMGGLKKQAAETNLINAQAKKTATDQKVSEKDLPKSELINDAYDVIRPLVKKLKSWTQDAAPKIKETKQENRRLP